LGNFFTAVKRCVEAMGEAPTGERYTVAGKAVSCGHCSRDLFVEGRAQLNTAGMTFLNLDWPNRTGSDAGLHRVWTDRMVPCRSRGGGLIATSVPLARRANLELGPDALHAS